MIFRKTKSGSVVIFCLLVLSIVVLFTEQLLRNVLVGSLFTRTMVDREHAEMLALGGVNLAIASLSVPDEDEKSKNSSAVKRMKSLDKKDKEDKADQDNPVLKKTKKLMTRLLPHQNRWRSFNLDKNNDGVEGRLKFCITAEQGKININQAFDFKKQEFKKEYEMLLKGLEIPGKMAPGEMFEKIKEFLVARRRKLDDVSELAKIPGFEQLVMFYEPPEFPEGRKNAQPNSEIVISDIFTIWSSQATIDPLVFSDALCAIFGVTRPRAGDAQKNKEIFEKVITSFNPSWYQDWEKNWPNIEPLYGEIPKFLKDVKGIFSKQFGPRVYSVLSCGKVGRVEQRVLAIVKEMTISQGRAEKAKKEQSDSSSEASEKVGDKKTTKKDASKESVKSKKYFKIIKIYWL